MAHKDKVKVPAKKTSKKVQANAGGDINGELIAGLTDALKAQSKQFGIMASSLNSLRAEMHLQAAGISSVESESQESESIEAGAESESEESESDIHAGGGFPFKKKKGGKESASSSESESMDSESMSADADDAGDLEEMESQEPDEDDKPGKLNKESKQKGSQTKVEDKVGREVNDPILGSSLKKLLKKVNQLSAARVGDQKTIKKLERQVKEQNKQITAAGQRTERRSISALGKALLSKAGMDADTIQASGRKFTVSEVDDILAGAKLDIVQRMDLKNQFVRNGLMEEGIVSRAQVN